MHPTLASLVQHPALKLEVLTGGDSLGAEVRWAHVSELADPVPYLEGGELLLTTGVKAEVTDPAAMRGYAGRLAGAGVVGLGFGVGIFHPGVPGALLAACREAGLPLLAVPRRTPFIAISKAVSAAIAQEQYRAVTAGFAAQRELTRAALSAGGHRALLEKLAAQVDGWTALYDATGAVGDFAPAWAERRAAALGEEVRRLCRRPVPASAVVGAGAPDGPAGDRVELQPVGGAAPPRAVLAIGTAGPPGTAARHAVQSAVSVLTLLTERSRALRDAERRLGAAVLHLLLSGEPEHARAIAGELYGGLLDAPLRIVVAEPAAGAGDDGPARFRAAMEAVAARAGEHLLAVPDAGRSVLVAAESGAVLAACAGYASDGDGRVVLGISGPAGPASADTACRQARQAVVMARRRGRTLARHDEVTAGPVLALVADDAVRAFADGLLRPLREHDARGRGDLVASLRAWLGHHGQWDAAAAELGVHRHTLRYRMRRVEELLDRSLDDADVRMELWLALKATGP
ncbi:PucR family transcriptional regulator [Streptomyces aidingensis]|uniref:Purine catabolism regulatory protein n=1 Tax=Streptomyces aidingensis TaxID=910347 RepID=A0A1I1P7Q8_9ACTN|nr:PucR family transcriptional regulator [Streptomyces aidingensis]SFD02030.1 purine catabolism regulatory protein [Streptomyces aidingensis]